MKIAGYPGRQHRAGNFQLCPRTGDKPHAVNHGGESAKLIGQRLHGATGDVDGEEGGSGVGQRLMVCRPQLAGFIQAAGETMTETVPWRSITAGTSASRTAAPSCPAPSTNTFSA